LVSLEHKIQDVWSGNELKFSHFRVFGCVAYVTSVTKVEIKSDVQRKA